MQREKQTDDLIYRQAAIDVLDRNHILGQGLLNDTLDHIADAIMALPSAQPEQTNSWCINSWCNNCKDIVRCKDCKYNSNTCGNYVNCDIIPQMFGRTVDNFCSMAERRTNE